MCYICGREYGSKSLEIHLKACKKKWDLEQEKKPAHQRKPCPQEPQGFASTIEKAKDGTFDQAYNNAAFENYNNKALDKCTGCGRTFLPESLVIHQKSCKAYKEGGSQQESS